MKFFQQMLVAPAALGLLASGANAAELNVNGVSDYAASADQVTSVTQFSDVYPTDWAYQALSNSVEQYGCVAGYPDATFRGNRAMTRYEAAALLSSNGSAPGCRGRCRRRKQRRSRTAQPSC